MIRWLAAWILVAPAFGAETLPFRTNDLSAFSPSFAGKHAKAEGEVHFTPEGYGLRANQVAGAIGEALANWR